MEPTNSDVDLERSTLLFVLFSHSQSSSLQSTMRFVLSALLGLACLVNAAAIPRTDNTTELVSRDVAGYRSVAYFVNWVSHARTNPHIQRTKRQLTSHYLF